MFSWFKKSDAKRRPEGLKTDLHSHLLPGLDDGVQTFDQAAAIIRRFAALGYTKVITTPHVMSDAYRNTTEGILEKLEQLREHLKTERIGVRVEAAAEYYLDEELFRKVNNNEMLLTFGNNYLLFETNFLTEPYTLKEFIFLATTKGYRLVLAHPERYMYLQQNDSRLDDLADRGVLFQVNTGSFTGHYSPAARAVATKLVERRQVHFLGTDCHHEQHMALLEKAIETKAFKKALDLPLLNFSL